MTLNTPSPGAPACALVAQQHFQSPRAGAGTATALCALLYTYRPGLTLCFQLLQDKLRTPTCDILHPVYTGETEKMSLFLFQNTEKLLFGRPFPRQNSMTDFCSMADNQCQNKVINTKKSLSNCHMKCCYFMLILFFNKRKTLP